MEEWLVKQSFYITYVFLLTTATITFIEAMRTKDSRVRHILNLETCISVVAAYFYGKFTAATNATTIDYTELNRVRYTDWCITTPIMLLVLTLAFLYNRGGGARLNFGTFLVVLALNYVMLGSGYAGEAGYIPRQHGLVAGFAAFFGLFSFMYAKFLRGGNFDNKILFWSFFVLWSGYGLLYYLEDQETRSVGYNVLDLFAKCFVGIFFWAYFTKVFTLK